MDLQTEPDGLQTRQLLRRIITSGARAIPLLLTFAGLGSATIAQTQEPPKDATSQFVRDVVPVLRDKCISCHGPKIRQAGLRLDTRIEILRGGKSGPAILENDEAKSLLVRRISGSEAGMQMPPTGALSEKEIESLRTWIREGAPWDSGASFTKEHAVVPEAKELFQAIRRGEISAIRKVLDRDPKLIGTVDENGSTPLILAAYWAGAAEVKELLARGADPNAKNDSGVAALIPATDNLESTRMLVEAGAEVNARTEAGDTALIVAAQRAGGARVVEYLLDKGANLKTATNDGATALHRAAECGDVDVLKLLVDKGADVDAQRKNPFGGQSPLASAVVFGHGAAVRYLLSKGAKANIGDAGLSRAVFQGNVEIVKALLEAGVEVKNRGNQAFPGFGGFEPILALACFSYNADPQIVRMLLDRGADPTAKSQQGQTPLELARERGYEDVARLLVQAIEKKQAAAKGTP
jgi:ankyrin repeat protein/mono/diheme cytochrome c family protein